MQIYKITNNTNGKIYIGKDESNRPNYLGSGKLIKRAITKYGIENFTKEIIEECDDSKILQEREKFWIKEHQSQNLETGYNISPGGDGGDTISNHTNKKEIIEKISKALKGRIFSEEHKKKLRENHNSKNPEVGRKISQKLKGRIFSEEHKEKLRQANLGKKRSPESIDKNRVAMKGRTWVNNPITGEELRVCKNNPIPEGFEVGRGENYAEKTSKLQKGRGYKYYKNPDGTEQKRVYKDQEPPKGWLEGRALEPKRKPTVRIEQSNSERKIKYWDCRTEKEFGRFASISKDGNIKIYKSISEAQEDGYKSTTGILSCLRGKSKTYKKHIFIPESDIPQDIETIIQKHFGRPTKGVKGKPLQEIQSEEEFKKTIDRLRENSKKLQVKVGKFNKQGDLVKIYESQREASTIEGIKQGDISNCCSGRQKTAGGYIWKKL